MTDDAWIQKSLAQLETLESKKAELEAKGQPTPLQLEQQIGKLYAALERAAEPDEQPSADPVYDEDAPSRRTNSFFGMAAVALLAVGSGGYWYSAQGAFSSPAPAAEAAPTIITASSVPEDTQEPMAAQGADVDRTQGTHFQESKSRARGTRRQGAGTRASEKPSAPKLTLSDSRDPLAGI